MNVKTVYLETSVLGSLAPRQPADRKRIVKELLAMLDGKRGVPAISAVVVEEVEVAPPAVAESIWQAFPTSAGNSPSAKPERSTAQRIISGLTSTNSAILRYHGFTLNYLILPGPLLKAR